MNYYFLDITPNLFYLQSDFMSSEEISYIWRNIENIKDYYKIDNNKFLKTFNICDDDMKINLIKYVNEDYICLLVKNKLIQNKDIWNNDDINQNILQNITRLKKYNILQDVIVFLDDYKFKNIISDIDFYYLEDIYNSIKVHNNKLKLFINGINLSYIEFLLIKMDDHIIDFIGMNLNYIFKLELIGNICIMNDIELSNLELSRLQIVLLLNTSNEKNILKSLIDYEIEFIRKIINKLNNNNFVSFFFNLKIDTYYQLVQYIKYDKLLLITNNNTNQIILREILINIKINDIHFIIPNLKMQQIISSTYELSDNKIIIIAKNLTYNQRRFLENLFNRLPLNQINEDIQKISKQILCYLYMCSSIKPYIDDNLHLLNNNKIKLLINFMNGDHLFILFKKLEFKKKIYVLSEIHYELIETLSSVIDRKLDYIDIDSQNSDFILIKIINTFIKLILSPNNKLKLN